MRGFIFTLIVVGVITYFLFGDQKNPEAQAQDKNTKIIQDAFDEAAKYYPKEVLQNAERIYQLETDYFQKHFTFQTGSAGMEAISVYYPYGWNSLEKFWAKNPQYKPIAITSDYKNEHESGMPLVIFPSFTAGVMTLCHFLSINENNPGRWHAITPGEQAIYNEKISKLVPAFVK